MPKCLKDLSKQLVFVCYYPGAGGERLATQISQFDVCVPLQYYLTEQSRTIITSDLFGKSFLMPVGPFSRLLELAKSSLENAPIVKKFHVVPSHWDVDHLRTEFPYSKYIRIISPENIKILYDNTDYKVMQGKFQSIAELKGYCLIYVDISVLITLLKNHKIKLSMTIGEIHSLLEPFIDDDNLEKNSFASRDNLYGRQIECKNILNIDYQSFEQNQEIIKNFLTSP